MVKARLLGAVGIVAVIGGIAAVPSGQTPASPAFEVASVKPNKSGATIRRISMPADRFEATNVPLQTLIAVAYGEPGPPSESLPSNQIMSGPSWINTEPFDIAAKADGGVPTGPGGSPQKLLMLQRLLAERFRLTVHHEAKETPIYVLVLARSDGRLGPRLHRSDVDCNAPAVGSDANAAASTSAVAVSSCGVLVGGGTMKVGGQTLSTVSKEFARLTHRVVVDRSGLTGAFDFDLQFNPEGVGSVTLRSTGDGAPAGDAPSLFTALQEQLGLKLESTTGPVDVLVIDHVEHPTED
jgi:uncharacterized protein (TIGR03435 family)